jgi:chromatin remodeling complex protein RSC6
MKAAFSRWTIKFEQKFKNLNKEIVEALNSMGEEMVQKASLTDYGSY